MKKKIGIIGNLLYDQGGNFPGYARSYVNEDYVESVLRAGGVPVILPVNTDEEVIQAQLEGLDALVFSGGYDVNPQLFGEEPHRLLGQICDERDAFDIFLFKAAMEQKLPILAICRGLQLINVACGGTLYQDCSEQENSYIQHDQVHTPDHVCHTVNITPDSALHEIFGDSTFVNSFHHMAVKDPAPDLRVTAVAPDGIIEGLESTTDQFILAVQWHPEMLYRKYGKMLDLFRLLIEKA